jgi:hypothetical protein
LSRGTRPLQTQRHENKEKEERKKKKTHANFHEGEHTTVMETESTKTKYLSSNHSTTAYRLFSFTSFKRKCTFAQLIVIMGTITVREIWP